MTIQVGPAPADAARSSLDAAALSDAQALHETTVRVTPHDDEGRRVAPREEADAPTVLVERDGGSWLSEAIVLWDAYEQVHAAKVRAGRRGP